MHRKKKARSRETSDTPSAAMHKAYRRMAFIFANLVCGIWVILLAGTVALEEAPPDLAVLVGLVVIGAPAAYAIPYGLVRLIGVVVIAVKTRRKG